LEYDKPLIAALLGALSTIPCEILTRALVFFGIGKYSVYQLDSLLITFTRPSIIMGLIVNFIIGGFTATIFYYALKKIGRDYLVTKSIFVGLLLWTFTELVFTSTIEGKYIEIRPISDYYVHIFGAIIYGITLGFLLKIYLVNRSAPRSNA
jgi:hypothetical protein